MAFLCFHYPELKESPIRTINSEPLDFIKIYVRSVKVIKEMGGYSEVGETHSAAFGWDVYNTTF